VLHSIHEILPNQGKYQSAKSLQQEWPSSQYLAKPRNKFISPMSSFITTYIIEWWLIEILSWTFAALCVGAIIGVLFYYDGREIPTWRLGGLTLNAFISIFSGLAKAALLLPTAESLGQLKW
jgi:hypothetical protein